MEIEICANSLESAIVANEISAQRVELCVNLEQGGTTPPMGLIKNVNALKNIENHVLIRCRPGDFVYSEAEIQMMCDSIAWCKEQNVNGVVIGALLENNELDLSAIERMMKAGEGLVFTFHRAIDEAKDWKKAINQLIELNFERILTSGQAKNVVLGKRVLSEMIEHADNRIQIMIGGGVKVDNIKSILQDIKPDAVHFSATQPYFSGKENSLFREQLLRTDRNIAEEIIQNTKN
tara:strand:+ start:3584 stop:4288 length:705 start_codon:yes stop_codon:yes gene_type:complete